MCVLCARVANCLVCYLYCISHTHFNVVVPLFNDATIYSGTSLLSDDVVILRRLLIDYYAFRGRIYV